MTLLLPLPLPLMTAICTTVNNFGAGLNASIGSDTNRDRINSSECFLIELVDIYSIYAVPNAIIEQNIGVYSCDKLGWNIICHIHKIMDTCGQVNVSTLIYCKDWDRVGNINGIPTTTSQNICRFFINKRKELSLAVAARTSFTFNFCFITLEQKIAHLEELITYEKGYLPSLKNFVAIQLVYLLFRIEYLIYKYTWLDASSSIDLAAHHDRLMKLLAKLVEELGLTDSWALIHQSHPHRAVDSCRLDIWLMGMVPSVLLQIIVSYCALHCANVDDHDEMVNRMLEIL